MSAIPLILLTAAATATAVGGAALHTARGLHRQLDELRALVEVRGADGHPARAATAAGAAGGARRGRLAAGPAGVPAARMPASADEIRAAVAEALAEERERELTEARAFWAAQELRDAQGDDGALLAGHGTEYEIARPGGLDAALLDALLEGRVDDRTAEALRDLPAGDVFVPRQSGPDDSPEADSAGRPLPPRPAAPAADEEAAAARGPLAGRDATRSRREAGAQPRTEARTEPDQQPATAAEAPDARGPQDAEARGPGSGDGRTEPAEPPELTAARRRHPSQPDYTLAGEPVASPAAPPATPAVADHKRTVQRLAELAHARTPLSDVRQGPLGTLDVYLFEDGTTVCLSPGHKETAEVLCAALRRGEVPVLMGGSSVSGGYALTFAYGPHGAERTAYVLADRVIASR